MNIFDTTTTDMSFYDNILKGKQAQEWKYIYTNENKLKRLEKIDVAFEIVEMSGKEYLEQCAEIHNSSMEAQLRMISEANVDELEGVVDNGKLLPLPVLNYVAMEQEGRHRAVLSIRRKTPMKVMVVKEAICN